MGPGRLTLEVGDQGSLSTASPTLFSPRGRAWGERKEGKGEKGREETGKEGGRREDRKRGVRRTHHPDQQRGWREGRLATGESAMAAGDR